MDKQDPEREWLKNVYRRGERQLTLRAVGVGMVIGAVMCLSNLYVVLKTGWSLGVTVTACILAYATFGALRAMRIFRGPLGILENSAMSSVASGAGYMTGGGNMAAVPALLVLTGTRPSGGWLVVWFATIAALGVLAAIPLKRQMVNIEQLPFPTGIATAETLRSMHSGEEKSDKGRFLAWAGVGGALLALVRDAKARFIPWNLPKSVEAPIAWSGHTATEWTMSFPVSSILVGIGAIMGFRVGWSLLLGGAVNYLVLAPEMATRGAIKAVSYKGIVEWSLWPGAAVLLSSGVLSLALDWRRVAHSMRSLSAIFSRKKDGDALEAVECPAWWFPAGFVLLSPVVVFLMGHLFGIPWWAGIVAIPLSLVMGIVAARVTGETDVTPTKALGPVTQLVYGAMVPGNMPANVMGANVTGGVGLHAADLLTDLKSGYLIGANPRQQFFAQLCGVVAGAAVVVPAFNLLVPDASVIGSDHFPAPAVQVWKGVSEALVQGLGGLHPTARIGVVVGLLVGGLLAVLERVLPARARAYIPSASGIGIGLVVPGSNALAMFLGAAIAEILRRRRPALAERTVVPVSSGFIAGESLMGILVAILVAVGVLSK